MMRKRRRRDRSRTPAQPHDVASTDRYLRALEASVIVSETDAEGVITRVNDLFCDVSGYSRSELLGATHRLVNSGFHPPAFFADLWQTIRAGRVWRRQIRNRRKDGQLYWVETTITPFLLPDGTPERYVSIRQDVTAIVTSLELLAASESRFRALFENAGVAIALIDASGEILEASPAFGRFVGHEASALRGASFTDFAASDDPREDERLFQALIDGRRQSYELRKRYRTRTGQTRWGVTHVSVTRGPGNGPTWAVGVVRDVTDVHDAEDRLREQAALAHLGEMAAVVAHEVRNPLAGILGATKMIGRGLPSEAPEQKVIASIADRIGSLERLVEELLVFARPSIPTPCEFDVRGMAESVRQTVLSDPLCRGTEILVEGEARTCRGDPALLERALLNLVINAVDAPSTHVRVRVSGDADTCELVVSDDGPGFPEGVPVLEPFVTTKSRGVGLGLATARRTVEAHGGRLSFGNRRDGGAWVRITWPRDGLFEAGS